MGKLIATWLAWLPVALSVRPGPALASPTSPDSAAVVATVEEYHEGFRRIRAPGRCTCTWPAGD